MGVSGDVIGRAVNAVLVPPQAERFAAVTGADLGRLVLNMTGWNKLVLLDSGRAFLFPRSADGVEWFERELAAYRALALTPLSVVPRLLGRWQDPQIYPFPFAAVTRLRGEVPAQPQALQRPPKPPGAWDGPATPGRGRNCWPAPHSSGQCWSTATSTKTSCLPKTAS